MPLLESLKRNIERELEGVKLTDLSRAVQDLSKIYIKEKKTILDTHLHYLAYLSTRFPATYAVMGHVLKELLLRVPTAAISSLLDMGAGFGGSASVALSLFPHIKQVTLVEQNTKLMEMGKKIYNQNLDLHVIRKTADFTTKLDISPHDLILFSYSIGEVAEDFYKSLLEHYWKITGSFLIIIEPGTPAGFNKIRLIREKMLSLGAHLIAPCPHQNTCPMAGTNWCHFSERLSRSSIHRLTKEGELNYEDEKFSYLIFSKKPHSLEGERILRYPSKRKGHLILELCTKEGVKKRTVSKKENEQYKIAKNSKWGDLYIPSDIKNS